MRSGSAASLVFIVEPCIIMCKYEYVARAIEDAICGLSGAVIQNVVDGFICALHGGRLL